MQPHRVCNRMIKRYNSTNRILVVPSTRQRYGFQDNCYHHLHRQRVIQGIIVVACDKTNKKGISSSLQKILVGVAIVVLFYLGIQFWRASPKNWKNVGWYSWLSSLDLPSRFFLFFLIHTIAVVGCFPGTSAIELGAGWSMNIYYGFICMYTSKVVAAMISFVLAKSILYRWTQSRIQKYPFAVKLMSAIAKRGWKLALFCRLSPIPSFVNNYIIALTPIAFRDYMIATLIGTIPFLFQLVILGAGIPRDVPQANVHPPLVSYQRLFKYIPIILGIGGLSAYMKQVVDDSLSSANNNDDESL